MAVRIGHGYDVHRLTEGRRLILCGVEVPYELGLLGHSDADVALLFIRSKATYYLPFPDGAELTRYWRNTPEWKEFRTTLQELVPLMEK